MFCTISKDILFCSNYSPTKGLCFYGDCVQKTGNGKEKVYLSKIVELLMFSLKSLNNMLLWLHFTVCWHVYLSYHMPKSDVRAETNISSLK